MATRSWFPKPYGEGTEDVNGQRFLGKQAVDVSVRQPGDGVSQKGSSGSADGDVQQLHDF